MKQLKFGIVCMLLLAGSVGLASAKDVTIAVREATDTLLAKLLEVQPIYEKDPESFFLEVDTALAPFIDFDGFSRAVMAKYYRQATPAQKQKFEETFRKRLIRTYAKALVEFDNQRVEVKEGSSPEDQPDRASVDLQIDGKQGDVYVVNYSLRNIDGEWKLRNVTIEGINIGLQFRSQFSAYMQQYDNDIDKVIENWSFDANE